MVNETACHVVKALRKFDTKRGIRRSTFIHIVSVNHCREICERYRAQKRTGVIVELSQNLTSLRHSQSDIAIAKAGVECILREASDELRRLLAYGVLGEPGRKPPLTPGLQREFEHLTGKYRVSFHDFSLVLRGV